MRKTFINTLVEIAEQDERILLLTGDLGYTVLEPFIERYPKRFFNAGVAEQNMVGIATGLAEAGFIPFVYSISTFATLRPYEFIRNGPIFHQFPVRIVGIGGGFEYGSAGSSHHSLEDIGVMRLHPGMTVVLPADQHQARNALLATWDYPAPIYYRISKNDHIVVPGLNGRYETGHLQVVRQGEHILFVTAGSISLQVVEASEILAKQGIQAAIAIVSNFNPDPKDQLIDLLKQYATVISVEAHYVNGGLGSLTAEIIAENNLTCRLIRCGVKQTPDGISGSESYMLQRYELDAVSLARKALQILANTD